MKIGVKTYDSEEFLKHFEDKADFFEIQALRKNNYDFLKNFNKELVIHAEHQGLGINPADKSKIKENLNAIDFAIKLADKYNAKKIILHPGYLDNKDCTEEQTIFFIKNINDKRILIENLPLNDEAEFFCTTPENTKNFIEKTKKKFCLDISHALVSANTLNKDYPEMIKEFIKLNPSLYHISGEKLDCREDEHLSFKDSELDIKKILKLCPKDSEFTLEVTF